MAGFTGLAAEILWLMNMLWAMSQWWGQTE